MIKSFHASEGREVSGHKYFSLMPDPVWRALNDAVYRARRKGEALTISDVVVDAVVEKLANDFPESLRAEDDSVWVEAHRYVWPSNLQIVPVDPVKRKNATVCEELGIDVEEEYLMRRIGFRTAPTTYELWTLALDWRRSKAGSLVVTKERRPGNVFVAIRVIARSCEELVEARRRIEEP